MVKSAINKLWIVAILYKCFNFDFQHSNYIFEAICISLKHCLIKSWLHLKTIA
jgi:hypothetical protein